MYGHIFLSGYKAGSKRTKRKENYINIDKDCIVRFKILHNPILVGCVFSFVLPFFKMIFSLLIQYDYKLYNIITC